MKCYSGVQDSPTWRVIKDNGGSLVFLFPLSEQSASSQNCQFKIKGILIGHVTFCDSLRQLIYSIIRGFAA